MAELSNEHNEVWEWGEAPYWLAVRATNILATYERQVALIARCQDGPVTLALFTFTPYQQTANSSSTCGLTKQQLLTQMRDHIACELGRVALDRNE